MIGRISKPSIIKYNVLGRISLSRTYLWNIAEAVTRVSKDQIYKWNITGRVSKQLTIKWVISFFHKRISPKTESRTQNNIPFDKWRSYLHRPQKTIHKRNSKYTRG
jgi:hypothetical protein